MMTIDFEQRRFKRFANHVANCTCCDEVFDEWIKDTSNTIGELLTAPFCVPGMMLLAGAVNAGQVPS